LLVFFAAMFVVVDGLSDTGLPDAIYWHLRPVFGSTVTTQTWNLAWFSVAVRIFSQMSRLFWLRGSGSRALPTPS
jgi:Na+/H+ antiporter NhaD/arsenite permease-like protein